MRQFVASAVVLAASAALLVASACAGGATPSVPAAGDDAAPPPVEAATAASTAPTVAPPAGATVVERDGPWVPPSSRAGGESRLNVTEDEVFIRNGGEVMLDDGLAVEVFLDPYPPSTLRSWLDLYLTKDGEPVPDASMGIEYDMLAMLHGPFWGEAENLGGGHYLLTLDYIMYGAWDQLVTVRFQDRNYRLPLIIVAYP